ncbi:hypothetical protein [Thermus tengchongensis]|uniref:hypothetical protein n=1 Tax=Thermus tengchongensis TaxID=1214928 RepID=UPI003B8A66C2
MGEAAKLLRPMGAEEYLAWEASQEERHELLEGLPYAMAGASEAHNLLEALALPGDSLSRATSWWKAAPGGWRGTSGARRGGFTGSLRGERWRCPAWGWGLPWGKFTEKCSSKEFL